jgi:hypothetical protein
LEIDRAIVAGLSNSRIALNFSASSFAIARHARNHLSRQLIQAHHKSAGIEATDLLSRIETLLQRGEAIFQRNYDQRRDRTALKALTELRGTLELLSRIAFSLHQARSDELQNNRALWQQEQQERFSKALSVLTLDELKALRDISMKIGASAK